MTTQQARIYKISSPEVDKFYIGSTTQTLNQRLVLHVRHYNLYVQGKFNYVSSFDLIKTGNFKIELIEEFEFENNLQMRKYEQLYLELFKNEVLNKRNAIFDKKEYIEKNAEKIKAQKNEKLTCECSGKFTRCNKVHHEKSKKHLNYINQKLAVC